MASLDSLVERSKLIRESLIRSQSLTDSMINTLASFDDRLSSLESSLRPTQVRTLSIKRAYENIDKTLKVAEKILLQFELLRKVESKIVGGPQEDINGYLAAVDDLHNIMQFFMFSSFFRNNGDALNRALGLLSKAMTKLEEEFRVRLTKHSKPQEPERLIECLPDSGRSTSSSGNQGEDESRKVTTSANGKDAKGLDFIGCLVTPSVIPQLHGIAQRMVAAGHHQDCCKAYRDVRFPVLEQTLKKLGVDNLTKDVHMMQWEVLEGQITRWMHLMKIAVKLLFLGERQICDQVFHELDPYRETCLVEVTGKSLTILLSFGEGIAKSKKSPEKLFVLLDMYETMRELYPEIETIFTGKPSAPLREAASGLTQRLAQTAEETFSDFSEAVEKDATKHNVQEGTVHPLTSYVINYVKFLFDYQTTLRELFGEDETIEPANSRLASATVKIMSSLQSNLEGKAKQYRDPALAQIFLMNNVHYMVKSVRRSEAKDVLGEDWVQRHRRVVQQHATNYRRLAWNKVISNLSPQGFGSGGDSSTSTGLLRAFVKERFKSFNVQFEESYQRQAQWSVPDMELREYLRLSVAELVLSAYHSLLNFIRKHAESLKNPYKYQRWSPEELEAMFGQLFEGKSKGRALEMSM